MNKLCRICLEEDIVSSIFSKNFNVTLCEMIEYCCNVKITEGDGLPEVICSNCIYKLGVAYHFKQCCETSEIRLRQHLGIPTPMKLKDAVVMTDPIPPVRTTLIKKCKCRQSQRKSTNYKRKEESEKLKRGPKPKEKDSHTCHQCQKEFRCQAQLDAHIRTHTGVKPFGCMFCTRRFTQKHNLTIHLRIHTGEKPYQCEVCSKTFSTQGNLQAHIKIHTGQKDHVCAICSKSFITSSELTRHMIKHRGIKNFKCNLCTSAYVHARDLKRHKLKKHQIDPSATKIQDNYSGNIDIISLDVAKERPPLKSHLIPNLLEEKTMPRVPEHIYKSKETFSHYFP